MAPTSVLVGARFDFTAFKLNRSSVPMTGVRFVFEAVRQPRTAVDLAGPGPERGILMPGADLDGYDCSLGLVDSPSGTAQLLMLRPHSSHAGEVLLPGASVALPLTRWVAVRPGLAIIHLTVFSNEFAAVRKEIAAVMVRG